MELKTNAGKWLLRMRRVVATACIGVLAVLIGYKVVFGANGTMEWRAKRVEYQRLQNDIELANQEHVDLENRVRKLQTDRNTIIKEAREKLGFVMWGDVVLVQPQPKADVRRNNVAETRPTPNPTGK